MNLKNCIVDKVTTMKDGSVKVSLVTRELTPDQMAGLFFNVNKEILSVDIDENKTEGKSKAQRLKSVLHLIWENHYKKDFGSSDLYYDHIMERIIDHYKEKID